MTAEPPAVVPTADAPSTAAVPPTAATLPVTVDVVALTVRDGALQVLLVERAVAPHRGSLALPGGFVLPGEGLVTAAARELAEETGVTPPGHLAQLRTYGPLGRDPRGPVLSVAYLLVAPRFGVVRAGSDAASATWHPVADVLPDRPSADGRRQRPALAFDHARILADGVERARAKLEYSALATAFCPDEFTVTDLRRVYEAVWGVRLDPRNFSRKATGTPGLLQDTGRTTSGGTGRPAALYRAASPVVRTGDTLTDAPAAPARIDPPLMRPSA